MTQRYYISETRDSERDGKTAMLKARLDCERVFDDLGITRVPFPHEHDGRVTASAAAKVEEHVRGLALWNQALAPFGQGDTVFVQYPPLNPCIWMYKALEASAKRGTRIVLVVHDLVTIHTMHGDEAASWHKKIYLREESRALKASWRASVHTRPMRDEVVSLLATDPDKLRVLEIFDYLIDERKLPQPAGKEAPLIVAGNLSPEKAGYLYDLPSELPVNLFGINFDEARSHDGLSYCGSYPAEELTQHLKGSFGIVWDGESARTCSGTFGDYLRYNSPHKLSLYLACGIPVIIWDQAAQATFVKRHNLGLTVSSLGDVPKLISTLSEDDYRAMRESAASMGSKLRSGWYTKRLVTLIA